MDFLVVVDVDKHTLNHIYGRLVFCLLLYGLVIAPPSPRYKKQDTIQSTLLPSFAQSKLSPALMFCDSDSFFSFSCRSCCPRCRAHSLTRSSAQPTSGSFELGVVTGPPVTPMDLQCLATFSCFLSSVEWNMQCSQESRVLFFLLHFVFLLASGHDELSEFGSFLSPRKGQWDFIFVCFVGIGFHNT
jgi:hypothetical protein